MCTRLSGGAFAALLGFYSHPSQYLSETVVQSSWSRPGFECAPLQNDPYYKVKYTYDECLANILEPNTATVVSPDTYNYVFYPFANNVGIHKDPAQNVATNTIYYNVTAVSYVCTGSDFTGLFVCGPSNSQPTQVQAITAFQQILTFYGGKEGLCEFTKTNAPFQCTRKQPIEVMQRISLSYAGAILVYSGLSVFFSWLMQYRKARIEKLRKVVASKGIVLTPENQESTV